MSCQLFHVSTSFFIVHQIQALEFKILIIIIQKNFIENNNILACVVISLENWLFDYIT